MTTIDKKYIQIILNFELRINAPINIYLQNFLITI